MEIVEAYEDNRSEIREYRLLNCFHFCMLSLGPLDLVAEPVIIIRKSRQAVILYVEDGQEIWVKESRKFLLGPG